MSEGRVALVDRLAWASAKDLRDVAVLTARWLESDIGSEPGYLPGRGPDSETLPLIATLARINRAGFLTNCSQPGFAERTGVDGRRWAQRPAVDGYVHPGPLLEAIRTASAKAGIELVVCNQDTVGESTVVTTVDGNPYTWFGSPNPDNIYLEGDLCPLEAALDISNAQYLALIGPNFNADNDLWEVLDSVS